MACSCLLLGTQGSFTVPLTWLPRISEEVHGSSGGFERMSCGVVALSGADQTEPGRASVACYEV